MECPHLGSSVCIAPDSAKFPQGSPSSWCCSGECGLHCAALPTRDGPAVPLSSLPGGGRGPRGEGRARGRGAGRLPQPSAAGTVRRDPSEGSCVFQPPLRPRGSRVSRRERGLLSRLRPCPRLPAQRCLAWRGQRTLSRRGRRPPPRRR